MEKRGGRSGRLCGGGNDSSRGGGGMHGNGMIRNDECVVVRVKG